MDFYVNVPPQTAMQMVTEEIVNGSVTGECIDQYGMQASDGRQCLVAVFEKHYYRVGNRLTLTVCIDNLTGSTRVHAVGGGGGEGLIRFDWGASESFEDAVRRALQGCTR